jgi:hypothetical protein
VLVVPHRRKEGLIHEAQFVAMKGAEPSQDPITLLGQQQGRRWIVLNDHERKALREFERHPRADFGRRGRRSTQPARTVRTR